jgi:Na+-driven multidrug efflux pump
MATTRVDIANTDRRTTEELLAFCLHAALAVFGGWLLAHLLSNGISWLFLTVRLHRIPALFTEVFGPAFWLTNVLFGLSTNRYTRHRSAPWVGLIGAVCLAALLVWDHVAIGHSDYYRSLPGGYWGYEFRQNFTLECSASECLGLLVTFPSLSLISYSIGAWLGLRISKGRESNAC